MKELPYVTYNSKIVRETVITNDTVTSAMDFIYDESGRPFAFRHSTNGSSFTTYYYVLNLQGDVVKLVNANGTAYATYTYNAWGEVLTSTGEKASINPLRYRGCYYDNETGFYYLQSRYYDPANHRFINADVFMSTNITNTIACNMFAYCGNNPVNYADSSGALPFAIGAVVLLFGLAVGLTGCEEDTSDESVIVLSNSVWMESSEKMGKNLQQAINGKSSSVVSLDDYNFSKEWNNATSGYVVIHTHGSPERIKGDECFSLDKTGAMELNRNERIKCVVITACSTGGGDDPENNIAAILSQKISPDGYVICSTGNVSGGFTEFTSAGRWVVYQNGKILQTDIPGSITMDDVLPIISSLR